MRLGTTTSFGIALFAGLVTTTSAHAQDKGPMVVPPKTGPADQGAVVAPTEPPKDQGIVAPADPSRDPARALPGGDGAALVDGAHGEGSATEGVAATGKPADTCVVCWDREKGFVLKHHESGRSLGISGFVQPLYEALGTAEDLTQDEVRIRRAYFGAAADLHDNVKLTLVVDFATSRVLLDAYATYTPMKALSLKVGQFKMPQGRQYLTSPSKRQFVDDSVATEFFRQTRDQGGLVTWKPAGDYAIVEVGAFNGTGVNQRQDNTDMALAGRLVVNPFGQAMPLQEADPDMSTKPGLALGVSGLYNPKNVGVSTATPLGTRTYDTTVGIELYARWMGLFASGEGFWKSSDALDADAVTSSGFFAQAGYFVVPGTLELAARYSLVRPDTEVHADEVETTAAVGWFIDGHRLKVTTDYSRLHTTGAEDENRGRVLLTMIF